MTKLIYVQDDGSRQEIDVPDGWTIMEGAVKNDVAGIDADCGGGCACATCHIYVAAADQSRLKPKSEMEETMLDFAPNLTAESRLSCQIEVTPALEGLAVRIPKTQR